jgi:hypothetical protein
MTPLEVLQAFLDQIAAGQMLEPHRVILCQDLSVS